MSCTDLQLQGKIFSVDFNPDSPFLLIAGGDDGKPHVINTAAIPAVSEKFGKK